MSRTEKKVLVRYRSAGGALVEVYEYRDSLYAPDSYNWTCAGCTDFGAPTAGLAASRKLGERHAAGCRALPQPEGR